MCTPTAAALVALNMGSSLMGIQAKNAAASSQATAMAGVAVAQTRGTLAQINLREKQESDKVTLEQVRRMRQGIRERSTIASRAADSGIAGGSTLRDAVASVIQEEQDIATLETNKEWISQQMALEKQGAVARGQSQVNQAQGILDSRTSGLGGVLDVLSAGVSGYAMGQRLEPMKVRKGD